jgi:tetratricopeptide (TPR) repeat protein
MRAVRYIHTIVRAAAWGIALCGLIGGAQALQSKGSVRMQDAAKALHEKGRQAGQRGDLPEAISLFTRAAELAPAWPYPIYDRAFAYLQTRNAAAALADYRRALELSPRGFFTARVAVDALQREQAGELPGGFYLAFAMLEFMPESQKRQVIPQLVQKFPQFAPAWLEFAKLASDPQERLGRIESGLRAQPDLETRGMLRLNMALTLRQIGHDAAANAIIQQVASDPSSSMAVESWAKLLLAQEEP